MPAASIDLGRDSRASVLEALACVSSSVDGSITVLVFRGNLAGSVKSPESESTWSAALTGVAGASQVTIGILENNPSGDDAAVLLLCDVVLACDDVVLDGWSQALPPPSLGGPLSRWISPERWTAAGALAAGLIAEVVPADGMEARLGEWLTALESWPPSELYEARALVRGGASGTTNSAITAWAQSRGRIAMEEF